MYQGQIGLKVKIPQSGSVLEHIVYIKKYEPSVEYLELYVVVVAVTS